MTEATPLASEQITQEDREAAANLPATYPHQDIIRIGQYDQHPIVQAFARHRIAALSASPAPSGQGVSGEPAAWLYEKNGKQSLQPKRQPWNTAPDRGWTETPLYAAPDPSCAPGEVAALIAELRPLVEAAAKPNGWEWMFPLRVNPVDGKPTIVSHKGGNLFRGYIGTWQEADLLVALANAAPRILAALSPQGLGEVSEGWTDDGCVGRTERQEDDNDKRTLAEMNALSPQRLDAKEGGE